MTDWKAKEAARAAAAAAMQAAFPGLVAVGGKVDRLNAAAKNMRIELKAAFPRVKFSVKSQRFSGGDSIDVRWIDGPTTAQVDEIVDKYKGGSFNGMDDSYTYTRDAWTDAFGDAKYIHSSRDYSDAAIASCVRTVWSRYGAQLEAAGASLPTAEDWRNNRLWSVDPIGGYHTDLQSLIGRELQRRTWALNKAAKAPARLEETAA